MEFTAMISPNTKKVAITKNAFCVSRKETERFVSNYKQKKTL